MHVSELWRSGAGAELASAIIPVGVGLHVFACRLAVVGTPATGPATLGEAFVGDRHGAFVLGRTPGDIGWLWGISWQGDGMCRAGA